MWPWNTQYSEFFVSNLFAQPPVIGTLLSNTNKIVEPKDIPNLQIPYTDLKLIDESHHNIVNTKDFKSDARLLEAVKQINPEFMIEEIVSVPGRHTHTAVKLEKKSKPVNLSQSSTTSPKLVSKSLNFTSKATLANSGFSNSKQKSRPTLSKQISESTELKTNDSIVKVEATGQTASSGIIPQIPFGSYFLSYLANDKRGVSKTAALILEPHSKAVVGNGGTAVSAPISKAFLKRGIPTNVYFNPESVAIAGVGGKAHAQADLELDLVD